MKQDGVVPLSRRGLGRLLAGALGVVAGSRLSAGVAKRKKRKDKPPDQPLCPPDGDDGSSAILDAEERALLTRINDYRGANGVPPLWHNAQLGAAAQAHAEDMGVRNYFAHDSPDGVTPQERAAQQGYCNPRGVGENILAGVESASEAFADWQASPGHNENMLRAAFADIGIGRAFVTGSEYGWYWTTVFGDRH